MPRAVPLLLASVLAFAACQREKPALVVAMEPRPNPPVGASRPPPADNPRERLRQNRWLAQFWEELTPGQRRRVEARMRRVQPAVASGGESAAVVWDGLGLADRDRLVFGAAGTARAAAPTATATAAAPAVGADAERPNPTP